MNKIKVMTVFGTRPEAIKMAPLVLKLKKDERFDEVTVVSAQHREMLDQVLDIFKIKPDYDFNIMHKNQTLEDITSKVMIDLSKAIKEEKPELKQLPSYLTLTENLYKEKEPNSLLLTA